MFSVITNLYNKKTKGPTLMELFTATGKLKSFFLQLESFDVWTTCDTANIDTIFKFLPHTRQDGCIDILDCCNDQQSTSSLLLPFIDYSWRLNYFGMLNSVEW
jgi:hypothetical protein